MRCEYCNKFASNDTSNAPEAEMNFEYDTDSIEVQGTARIYLTSECCGAELSDANLDIQQDVTEPVRAALLAAAETVELPEGMEREALVEAMRVYPLNSDDLMEMMDSQEWDDGGEVQVKTITGKNKTLKSGVVKWIPYSPRYYRTEYGVELNYSVSGTLPVVVDGVEVNLPVEIDLGVSEYIPASSMEPLN